jgi:hypothetical protein
LHKNEFQIVVKAFQDLIETFLCNECNAMLFVNPEYDGATEVRCLCSAHHYNLKAKS